MNRHSNDLRIRVVKHAKLNGKLKTAKLFKIARQTVYDWLELDRQGKLKEVVKYQTRKSKLDYSKIEEFVNQHPDLYYREIGEHFHTSDENIRKILKKLNYTVKKNKRYTVKRIKS